MTIWDRQDKILAKVRSGRVARPPGDYAKALDQLVRLAPEPEKFEAWAGSFLGFRCSWVSPEAAASQLVVDVREFWARIGRPLPPGGGAWPVSWADVRWALAFVIP